MKIKLIAAAGGIGLAMGCAGFVGAANATAGPMDYQCAPCVADINNDGKNDPVWNEVTSFGPWEPLFDGTNGKLGDKKGAWESGVGAVNGGSWEKAFPPAND
jgi:hypothetical protein